MALTSGTTYTPYQFREAPLRGTAQRNETALGLYFYREASRRDNARWPRSVPEAQQRGYDPSLGRFTSADIYIPGPGNTQAWDRYAYALNSPLKYTDPSGHFSKQQLMKYLGVSSWKDVLAMFEKGGTYAGMWGWLEVLRNAKLGDDVGVYKNWNKWDQTYLDTTLFSGTLIEVEGSLYLQSGDNLMPLSQAISQSEGSDGVWQSPGGNTAAWFYPLHTKNYHIGLKEWKDIDKLGLTVDIFGIVGDVVSIAPGGQLVWGASEIAEVLTVSKAWDELDMGNPSSVLVDTGATILESSKLAPGAGFVGNLISIGTNVFEITP